MVFRRNQRAARDMVFLRDPGEIGKLEKEEERVWRDKPRNAERRLQLLGRPNNKQIKKAKEGVQGPEKETNKR